MVEGMKYHHIGIACEDIDATAKHYQDLGYVKGEKVVDPLQNIEICFLDHADMPRIELLAPVNGNSPVVQTLQKNGTTPYHICYTVDNLDQTVKDLKKQHFLVVAKAKPACAIENRRVTFLYNKDTGLIELVESESH